MLMKVKITAAALVQGGARQIRGAANAARYSAADKSSTPACSKFGLLAPCLSWLAWPAATILIYFHDSNEVVIHFSVKLMMLQISSTYLKEMS